MVRFSCQERDTLYHLLCHFYRSDSLSLSGCHHQFPAPHWDRKLPCCFVRAKTSLASIATTRKAIHPRQMMSVRSRHWSGRSISSLRSGRGWHWSPSL